MEMLLDKKQIWVIFLFDFKTDRNAGQTTCNINDIFDSGTAHKCTVQWWLKKFCKGQESLEGEKQSGRQLQIDNDQMKGSSKLILFQLHEKLPKNSTVEHSLVIRHLKEIGNVGKLSNWVSHELTENQKHHHLEVSSLTLCNNNKPFLD